MAMKKYDRIRKEQRKEREARLARLKKKRSCKHPLGFTFNTLGDGSVMRVCKKSGCRIIETASTETSELKARDLLTRKKV